MSTTITTSRLKAVCKLRWQPKAPADLMTIRNLDALRLMCDAIMKEQAGKWDEAGAAQTRAMGVLEQELQQYLAGIKHTVPVTEDSTWSMSDLGDPL